MYLLPGRSDESHSMGGIGWQGRANPVWITGRDGPTLTSYMSYMMRLASTPKSDLVAMFIAKAHRK